MHHLPENIYVVKGMHRHNLQTDQMTFVVEKIIFIYAIFSCFHMF